MFTAKLQTAHSILIPKPILQSCFFTIVIPVRNEAHHLLKTLESLSCQINSDNRPLDPEHFEIIFLVNNTTDDSLEIIRRWSEANQLLTIHFAEVSLADAYSNIGYVRRWLMNEAHLRLKNNKFGGGIIATTDADTQVAPNWIAATIAEIKNGAEAVGGRIIINASDLKNMNSKARAFHLRDTGYRLLAAEIEDCVDRLAHDSFPRHHQHFNGSFAVTTAAFERAGGVPEVRFLEDVAFYHSLLRVDAKFRHSPQVRVLTSARSEGRTEAGLSTQINEWAVMGENGASYLVEGAAAIERRLCERRKLRHLWNKARKNDRLSDEMKSLADNLMISPEFLRYELCQVLTFGGLYERILNEQHRIGEWQKKNPLVSVEKAIFDVRVLLKRFKIGREKTAEIVKIFPRHQAGTFPSEWL